ncbi:MAG: hypothetical protein AB1656_19760 [Candidatus Omnitrophota bacterium]
MTHPISLNHYQLPKLVLLTALMLFAVVSAHAQTRELSLPDLEAAPGETLTIQVRLSEGQGVVGFRIVIDLPNFSADYPLEYVNGSSSVTGTMADGWASFENNASTNSDLSNPIAGLVLINGSGMSPLSGEGVLVTFQLKIKENAASQTISLNFKTTGSKVSRLNDGAIPVSLHHGSIKIKRPPPIVFVSDNESSNDDISNGQDHDPANGRVLVVQWDISRAGVDPQDIKETHVYVKNGGGDYAFLGRAPSGNMTQLVWRQWGPNLAPTFRDGPQFGGAYQFKIYPIKKHGGNPPSFGPFANDGPVLFLPMITITDSIATTEDLSNGQDRDYESDRSLAIRWTFDSTDIDLTQVTNFHAYVRINSQGVYRYLGQTGSGTAAYLEWKPGNALIASAFRSGPQFDIAYEFRVYAVKSSAPPIYGPLENAGPVLFLQEAPPPGSTPTPTPTPVPTPKVYVADNDSSDADISNSQDHDDPNQRELAIGWDFTQTNIDASMLKDIHVYVNIDESENYSFLGAAGSGAAQKLLWKKGTPRLAQAFRNGPEFGHDYQFKIYAVKKTGTPNILGPFANPGPVEYLPIVTVTDTLLTLVDLSNGQDADPADQRDLVIRWAFDPTDIDRNNVKEFHLYTRINQTGSYQYLGRIDKASVYLEWKAGNASVAPAFRNGPELGHRYEFRVYAIKQQGKPAFYGPFENIGAVRMVGE